MAARLAELAAAARAEADRHPPGSLERRAWACVGVALGTARTVPAARTTLTLIPVPAVRDAAGPLLARLLAEPDTERPDAPA